MGSRNLSALNGSKLVYWYRHLYHIDMSSYRAVLQYTSDTFNTLSQGQNVHRFPDNIYKCNFLNENVWISIKSSLKFVSKGPINNIPALVQIMAWGWPGNKPMSEPMMVSLLMHICITLPQWVNYAFVMSVLYAISCNMEWCCITGTNILTFNVWQYPSFGLCSSSGVTLPMSGRQNGQLGPELRQPGRVLLSTAIKLWII